MNAKIQVTDKDSFEQSEHLLRKRSSVAVEQAAIVRGFPTRIYFLASVALNDRSEYAEGRTPEGRKRQLMGCTR